MLELTQADIQRLVPDSPPRVAHPWLRAGAASLQADLQRYGLELASLSADQLTAAREVGAAYALSAHYADAAARAAASVATGVQQVKVGPIEVKLGNAAATASSLAAQAEHWAALALQLLVVLPGRPARRLFPGAAR
jgi:hypothetical protein